MEAGVPSVSLLFLFCLQGYDVTSASIESQPRDYYKLEGHTGTIRCKNTTTNIPVQDSFITSAEWYRVAPNSTSTRVVDTESLYSSGGYALVFDPMMRSHEGQYYCCTPERAKCSEPSTVGIAEMPEIEVVGSQYTAAVGGNFTLQCNIDKIGVPPPTFGWRKDGVHVTGPQVTVNSTHVLVELINVTKGDAGAYRCYANALLGLRTTSLIMLSVAVPVRVALTGLTSAPYGSKVHLTCVVLEGDGQISFSILTPLGYVWPNSELTIGEAELHDGGTYTCKANNSVSTSTAYHQLLIYSAPQPASLMTTVFVSKSSDVILSCMIDVAFPVPTVHWDHLRGQRSVSSEMHPLKNGSLLLVNVQESGVYQCNASNVYGNSVQTIHMFVDGNIANSSKLYLIVVYLSKICESKDMNKQQITRIIEEFIFSEYDRDIAAINNHLLCNNTEYGTYSANLYGPNADHVYALLLRNTSILISGLYVTDSILICLAPGPCVVNNINVNMNLDNTSDTHNLVYISVSAIFVIVLSVILLLMLLYLFRRNRSRRDAAEMTRNTTIVVAERGNGVHQSKKNNTNSSYSVLNHKRPIPKTSVVNTTSSIRSYEDINDHSPIMWETNKNYSTHAMASPSLI